MDGNTQGGPAIVRGPLAGVADLFPAHTNRVLILSDEHVGSTLGHAATIADVLSGQGHAVETTTLRSGDLGTVCSALAAHDALRSWRADLCVALGGGSVIDAAKLARAAFRAPWVLDRMVWTRSAGRVTATVQPTATPSLVAVPTRPGSAAEVSPRVALAPRPGASRRLMDSAALVPDAVLVDPAPSAALPSQAWSESLAEILFRVVGPFLTTRHSTREQDQEAISLMTELVRIGEQVLRDGSPPPGRRADVFALSSRTVLGSHSRGWYPGLPAWWCVQNSVCAHTGITKGHLTALALPELFDRIEGGDTSWGCPQRWRQLKEAGLAARLRDYCARFRENAPPQEDWDDADLTLWARDVLRLWAGHHPDVAGMGAQGIEALLRGIRATA
ncbi:iron-containing alcohol dehydrogenase [Nocardiopsis sp. MG754419]|uniref:iron-containing alcohol dehydrogenase n=1 Tax=Nocardiopsis sp. MG754419 TaxID=2259865 RepID=UPI001BAE352F|nr:iron-containing alcohol dehydrogenase [Nocardiopsis sp. MG754419]